MRRLTLLVLGLLTILGCQRKTPPPPSANASAAHAELRLVAVGDIMMHQDVKRAARDAAGGFPELWRDLAPLFQGADLVFGNLETPVAPRTGQEGRPFLFNAPEPLALALRQSGFQVLATANNHAYDQGPKGVVETLEHLRRQGLTDLGSGLSRAEAEAPRILERKGLRIGFLGATDIFNSKLNRSEQGPWVAALEEDRLVEAVRRLRPQVDGLVLSLHWGTEYQHRPSERQCQVARRLVEAGVDLIIGHHPHVLQPMAWVEAGGRRGAVAYSLGNFISNQDRTYNPATMPEQAGDSRDSAAIQATWVKDGSGPARLASVNMDPLWTDNSHRGGKRVIRVLRIAQQTDALAQVRRRRIGDVLADRLPKPTLRLAAKPIKVLKPRPKRLPVPRVESSVAEDAPVEAPLSVEDQP